MKKLILKPEYTGICISKNNFHIGGHITFNSLIVSEIHYRNYYNLGFDFLFEEVEVVSKEVFEEIKTKNKKK